MKHIWLGYWGCNRFLLYKIPFHKIAKIRFKLLGNHVTWQNFSKTNLDIISTTLSCIYAMRSYKLVLREEAVDLRIPIVFVTPVNHRIGKRITYLMLKILLEDHIDFSHLPSRPFLPAYFLIFSILGYSLPKLVKAILLPENFGASRSGRSIFSESITCNWMPYMVTQIRDRLLLKFHSQSSEK